MTHTIDSVDSDGIAETINNFSKLVYVEDLNGTRTFDMVVEGASVEQKTRLAIDNLINVYKFGSLDVKFAIKKRSHTGSGMLRLQGIGFIEQKLKDANAPDFDWVFGYTSETVIEALLLDVDTITKGTLNHGYNYSSCRTYSNQSIFYAIYKILKQTGQDWNFDDDNNELDVLDHKGSSTSVGTLNDGIDIDQVTWVEDEYESVNRVTVIGKNEGGNQISYSYGPGWSQGEPEITIVDKSINDISEAIYRAMTEYTARNGTSHTYTFRMLNQAFSFVVGDVITINSPGAGLSDTNVRIVSRKWVITPNNSQLYVQVRSTTDREAASDRLSMEQERRRSMDDANAMKQGTDDAVSVTGVTGGVTSGPSETDVTGGVTEGASETDVTGGINSYTLSDDQGNDESLNTTLNIGWNTNVVSEAVVGTIDFLRVRVVLHADFSGADFDVGLKIHMGGNYWVTRFIPHQNTGVTTYVIRETFLFPVFQSIDDTIYVDIYSSVNQQYDIYLQVHSTPTTHTHTDTLGTSDSNHPHEDDFGTSDSNHPHEDSFDTSDSDHSH